MGNVLEIDLSNQKELFTSFQLEKKYDHGLNTSAQPKQKSSHKVEFSEKQTSK